MTRARAAAKAGETTVKTAKIVTAAAKARSLSSATASTKSTAAKRKTRADENDDAEDDFDKFNTRKTTRARSTKACDSERSSITTEATSSSNTDVRCRVSRKPADEAKAENSTGLSRLRGRPRKTPLQNPEPAAGESTTKATRPHNRTASKTNAEDTRPAMKKTVKFQEAGKENVSLASKAKAAASTSGLRVRPSRRAATAMSKSPTNSSSDSFETASKKPLSPKKVTQMPVSRDRESSEDELAGGGEPRMLMKSPIKSSTNQHINDKPLNITYETNQDNQILDATTRAAVPASTLASPPRRLPTSPTRDSLKSPAKRPGCSVQLPGSLMKPRPLPTGDHQDQPALFQSPAKRPPSPIKGSVYPLMVGGTPLHGQTSVQTSLLQSPAKRAMPGMRPLADGANKKDMLLARTPKMQPIVASSSNITTSERPSQLLLAEESQTGETGEPADDPFTGPIDSPRFPGRMSAVLPRHADPLLNRNTMQYGSDDEELDLFRSPASRGKPCLSHSKDLLGSQSAVVSIEVSEEGLNAEPMALGESARKVENVHEVGDPETQKCSEAAAETHAIKRCPMFQLRGSVLNPCHDFESDFESEDDLSPLKQLPVQQSCPGRRSEKGRDSIYATQRASRRSTLGLTSLAEQFGAWAPVSSRKASIDHSNVAKDAHGDSATAVTPTRTGITDSETISMSNSFFEDEILVHSGLEQPRKHDKAQAEQGVDDDAITMEDIVMTDEDVALAAEANNMSLMADHADGSNETQRLDEVLSEASQEYGDENKFPVDPSLSSGRDLTQSTPSRPFQQRPYFTTTKIPLKPADDSEPSPCKKRGRSASHISAESAGKLPRSATVISYSPTKEKQRMSILSPEGPFSIQASGDLWSYAGTPGRTPRRDINSGLLRGAVVFVDVHTTEGADASGIFVELLSQMGAKCVKTWYWNPTGSLSSEGSTSKVGITHVVFKDGGKRTMEKVRQTNGVVHCVGVSWVLE